MLGNVSDPCAYLLGPYVIALNYRGGFEKIFEKNYIKHLYEQYSTEYFCFCNAFIRNFVFDNSLTIIFKDSYECLSQKKLYCEIVPCLPYIKKKTNTKMVFNFNDYSVIVA